MNLNEQIERMKSMMGLINENETNEGLFDSLKNFFGQKKKIELPQEEIEIFTCKDCGNYDYDMYMVNDDIWREYGNESNTLCMDCLEKRMGRELTKDDFSEYKKTPANIHNPKVRKILNSKD